MCGIAGVAGYDISLVDREIFRDILLISALRGIDSTGVMMATTFSKQVQYHVEKSLLSSSEFIKHNHQMLDAAAPDLFMGHCRWGTVGKNTAENAHPFDLKNIVALHNGTLTGKEYRQGDGTDSEIMFKQIDDLVPELGTAGAITKVLENLEEGSAFAIAIWDKKDRHLFLAHNNERKIYVGFRKDKGVMFWASEVDFIDLCARRKHVALETFFLTKNLLYEIDVDEIVKGNMTPWYTTPIDDTKYKNYWQDYDRYAGFYSGKKTTTSSGSITVDAITSNNRVVIPPKIEALPSLSEVEDAHCCVCYKDLTVEECLNQTPVNHKGQLFYTCVVCDTPENEGKHARATN